ncbi:MAG: MFS transporter [Clostridiaceae bacterium]
MGTVGQGMLSPLVSMCFIYYLADVLDLTDETMWTMTGVLTLRWICDAVQDPRMGMLVDNTRAGWGRFNSWFGPDEPGRS